MTSNAKSSIDVVEGVSGVLVGAGIITFALFPLALPLIALTAVAVIPFLLPVLAVGLVVAIIALPLLVVRRLRRRRATRAGRRVGSAESSRPALHEPGPALNTASEPTSPGAAISWFAHRQVSTRLGLAESVVLRPALTRQRTTGGRCEWRVDQSVRADRRAGRRLRAMTCACG